MARERCCVTSSQGNLSYIMLYSLSIFIAYFYFPVSLSQVRVTNIGRAQVILQEDLRFKLNVKNAGKKIACATICHSKGEANYVSSTLATKLFSMARAGEFQIPAFPDFDSALNELKQFQRSPQPDYQVCVATADGALVVKQTLVDFWTVKHTSFADQMQKLLQVHDNEFNTRKLKRGAEETEDAPEEERPTKRLCPGTSSSMEELETNHPDRTLTSNIKDFSMLFEHFSFYQWSPSIRIRTSLNAGSFVLYLSDKDASLWIGCSAAVTVEANTELWGFGSGDFAKGSEGADMMSDTSAEGRWLLYGLQSSDELLILEKQRKTPEHLESAGFFNKADLCYIVS